MTIYIKIEDENLVYIDTNNATVQEMYSAYRLATKIHNEVMLKFAEVAEIKREELK